MRNVDYGQRGHECGHVRLDGGFVLMTVVVLLAGLIFLAATAAIRSSRLTQVTAVELDNTRAFYAAEAAVEWGAGHLDDLLEFNIDPTQADLDAMPLPDIDGYSFSDYRVEKVGALTAGVLSEGDYAGLQGFVQRYTVQGAAASSRREAAVVREVQHQFIPLFQFGVFYESDLEIFPGPLMTFTGPIHTNSDLYMGAETEIQCTSNITTVGRYWHHRKNGARNDPPGPVRILDNLNVWQNVWRGSYWLDNRHETWASEANTVWGGNFRDQAHGLTPLRLPIPPAANQHITVEQGLVGDSPAQRSAKYWYQATVRYVNGVLTDSMGTPLVQPGVYVYQADKFWDDREDKQADVVTVDINAMRTGGYRPSNGIVYITENRGDFPVVRIVNGGTLPNGGLTIVTDRPMYVKGHFNNIAKKGGALYSDAMTLLSPAWNDANSTQPLANRVPSNHVVNACILTGHVPSVPGGSYSGGLENNFRFLERWTTQTNTYSGSIVDLWFSLYAVTPWSYGVYYTAPARVWSYDAGLADPANWPPGTPRVRSVQRCAWRQIS